MLARGGHGAYTPGVLWGLYQIVFIAAAILSAPFYLYRMARRGGYLARFGERFAQYRPDVRARLSGGPPPIWIHAVSVGEMQVALSLAAEWRRREPSAVFVLSTTTSTGRQIAARRLDPRDTLIYFPIDLMPTVRRALAAIRPRALVLCESELWPNLIRACAAGAVPVAVINGRLSDRSYRRYRWGRALPRRLFPLVTRFCVQSREDARRFEELGAPRERVVEVGSAKYDGAAPDPLAAEKLLDDLRHRGFPPDAVYLVGGSTWPGEEAALARVARSLRSRFPALRLLLAPRHAERGSRIAEDLRELGCSLYRRSTDKTDTPSPDVALFDTTGELAALYGVADMVFIGKSLYGRGGQNPIEAALWGRPILCGPHMENFRPVMDDFREVGAVTVVSDEAGLLKAVADWLQNPDARREHGRRALEVTRRRAGAVARTVDILSAVVPSASTTSA